MLTDLAITKTKPDPAKEIRLADGEGLHVAILPNGKRYWRWDYTYEGRRKQLSFGKYPRVTLKMARARKTAAQQLLDAGTDPSAARRQEKIERQREEPTADPAMSFQTSAEEWLEIAAHTNHPSTVQKKRSLLKTYLLPTLATRPIDSIMPADLLPLLKAIERLSKYETAHRVRQMASEIFRYAIASARTQTDPAALLDRALKPVKVRHYPAITEPVAVGALLTAIDHAESTAPGLSPVILAALRLAPLLFVRPGELRGARWAELNLDAAMWRIPAARMKPTAVRIDHLVPLSTQAVTILRELRTIIGSSSAFVFPGLKTPTRPISDATLATVLRRLGYSREQQSVHGFRTLASTHLREIGFENDLVELQLSHKIANPVRAAYDKAARVPERVKMMQAYADHLDDVKAGRVVSFTARVLEMPGAELRQSRTS